MRKVRVRLRLLLLLRDASAWAWVPMPPIYLPWYRLVCAFIAVAVSALLLFVNVQHLPAAVSAL